MKILHLSSEKTWRGGEQQIAYLVEELTKAGIESVVAVRKDSEFENWCKRKNIEHYPLNFKNDLDIASAWKLKSYCSQVNPDLLHLHSSRSHGIAYLAALLGNKTPMILSRRVDFPIKDKFGKYNHPAIKKIICVSEKVKQLVAQGVRNPELCVTIYDGIDLNRFAGKGSSGAIRAKYGIGKNELLIGNIAALAPHKDHFTFLRAAYIIADDYPVKYLIAGEGSMRPEIEMEIKLLGLQNKVIMTGFISDLEYVYADLDVLMFTSSEEGLGSSLLDAMACDIPIVATAAGGVPEIVIDEVTGLVAPVGDAAALAQKVIRLFSDENLSGKLIQNAKQHVRNFSKEIMAAKTIDVYKEVLSGKK